MQSFAVYLYGPGGGPLPTSFEAAAERLQQLERCYLEPDGSFTWVIDAGQRQQVDGMLYDAEGRLQYVDLKGTCGCPAWQRLVARIAPATPLTVLPVQQGGLQQLQVFERAQWGEPPATCP